MYTVPQGFTDEMYKYDRLIFGKVAIGTHEFADSGALCSASLRFASANNQLVGQAVSQSADVEMNISDEDFQTYFDITADVVVYLGVSIDGTVTYIPRPPMRIMEYDYDKDTGKLTFSCVDYMCKADEYTVNDLPDMEYPVTVDSYLQAICDKIGVQKSTDTYFNSDVSLSAPPNFDGSESLRTALKGIAQMCLSNCYINKYGALEMMCIADAASVGTITGDYYSTVTAGKKIVGINAVSLERQPQNDIIYAKDDTLIAQNGESPLVIENNPFMDSDRETFAPALLNKIKGLSFYPCEINWRGNVVLDPFDKLTVETLDEGTFSTYLFSEDLIFNGGIKSTIKCDYDNNKTVNYAKGATIKDKLKNAEIEVDKVKNQITSLVQEDNWLQSQIIQTADNIRHEVEEKYATEESVGSRLAAIDVKADQIVLSVEKAESRIDDIESDGVTKVANTTGTFDENGLTISKTGEEMSNVLDNTGMYVKRNGEEILTANNNGVDAVNLHAKTSLIIGAGNGRSRFEDYLTNRTGCFWVGG